MAGDLYQRIPFLNVPIQSMKPIVESRSDELTVSLDSLLVSPDIKEEELLYHHTKKTRKASPEVP